MNHPGNIQYDVVADEVRPVQVDGSEGPQSPWSLQSPQTKSFPLDNVETVNSGDDRSVGPESRLTNWTGWWWELLAMVASIACLVAIVAILITMDGRRLSDWHFYFGIPATIAFFGTANKSLGALAIGACISQYKWLHFKRKARRLNDLDLLEEASRGSLGSLILLVRRPLGLASIGAAVTLLAVGLEVFIQQMVLLTPMPVFVSEANATLGLSHTYNGGAKYIGALSAVINVRSSSIDTGMQGAVYRGLFNLDSPPLFNCSSSCRWNGTYVSLGFTSTCADVTEATLRLHPNASETWDRSGMSDMDGMYLTTPGDVKLDATYSYTSYQTVISVGAISLLKPDDGAVPTGSVTRMGSGIARIAVLRVPVDATNWGFTASDMNITECDVSLAAHRFQDLSTSGANLTASRREVLNLDKGIITARDGHADYLTFNTPGLPKLRIAVPDLSALGLLFTSSRFSGNIFDGEASSDVESLSHGMGDAFLRTPDPAVAIHAMTDSMTDQLRATHETVAAGESQQQIVFVQVEWGWLALPVVVQIIAVVFLVLVLVQSGRASNLPLWKSSIVALLTYDVRFSDMDGQEHAAADYVHSEKVRVGNLGTGVRSTRELDALAETVKAKLDLPVRNRGGQDGAV